jgi:hypothetical protein
MNVAWSRVGLELILNSPSVKQGEISSARLIVKQAEGQAGLNGLQGKNLGQTLYLLNVSPFMGKEGALEAEAKVIFLTVPSTNAVSEQINNEEVFIVWNNIEILPTESSQSFLLGDFDIPARRKIIIWVGSFLLALLIVLLALWLKKRSSENSKRKTALKNLKQKLLSCTNYEETIEMWKNKKEFLATFPKIEESFKKFEIILFQHQFKSKRTEREIEEVVSAYKNFKNDVMGVLNEY